MFVFLAAKGNALSVYLLVVFRPKASKTTIATTIGNLLYPLNEKQATGENSVFHFNTTILYNICKCTD